MSQPPLLDTHIWIWWLTGDARLDKRVRSELDSLDRNTRPHLSAISLWETAMLIERRRIEFTTPVARWLREATAPQIVELVPITVEVAAEVAALPVTFHRDPADRIIVATSRILGLPLITDDRRILTSRLVSRWRPTA